MHCAHDEKRKDVKRKSVITFYVFTFFPRPTHFDKSSNNRSIATLSF